MPTFTQLQDIIRTTCFDADDEVHFSFPILSTNLIMVFLSMSYGGVNPCGDMLIVWVRKHVGLGEKIWQCAILVERKFENAASSKQQAQGWRRDVPVKYHNKMCLLDEPHQPSMLMPNPTNT